MQRFNPHPSFFANHLHIQSKHLFTKKLYIYTLLNNYKKQTK